MTLPGIKPRSPRPLANTLLGPILSASFLMTAALQTQEKITSLGWKVLPYLLYLTDVACTDFHLFQSLEHFINGRTFRKKEVENGLSDFFKHGIENLPFCCFAFVENKGDYIFYDNT